MTTAITTLTTNCEAFAVEQGFTKQQTIAFTILAIFEQGYGIARAVEMVCGLKPWKRSLASTGQQKCC